MIRPADQPHVLLVNPWITDFAAFDLWARPLGLLYLGAWLTLAGAGVRLVDALDRLAPGSAAPKKRAAWPMGTGQWHRTRRTTPEPLKGIPRYFARYGLPEDVFRRALSQGPRPTAVFVGSGMTYWYPGVVRAIEMIHEVHPGVPVVLGGHYATLCPDHARSFSGADVVLPGPIEESWSRLKDVPGLESLADPPPWTDIRPALNLYPRMDAAPIMTSRGCPLRCPYCASGRLYPAFEARSPGDVLDEIEKRVAIGIRHFVFFDDALLYQAEKRLIPLLEGVIARGLDIRFHAPNGLHVGSISKELARLMKRAGFETLRLGVESLDPDRQRRLGGKVAGGAFETAAERLVGAGFDPGGIGVYILFGLPGQDLDEVRGTIQAVRSVGCRPYLAEYSPLPGTPLWEEAVRVSPFDLAAEPLYQNNSFFPCRGPEFSWERIWEIKRLVKE